MSNRDFGVFGTLGARPAMGGGTRPKLRFSRISRALRPQSPPKLHGRWGMVVGGSRESLVHGGALGRAWGHFEVPILRCKKRLKATKRGFSENEGCTPKISKIGFCQKLPFWG